VPTYQCVHESTSYHEQLSRLHRYQQAIEPASTRMTSMKGQVYLILGMSWNCLFSFAFSFPTTSLQRLTISFWIIFKENLCAPTFFENHRDWDIESTFPWNLIRFSEGKRSSILTTRKTRACSLSMEPMEPPKLKISAQTELVANSRTGFTILEHVLSAPRLS